MKNKEYLKVYLIRSLIVILLFTFLFIFLNKLEYSNYKRNFNYKINAILKEIQEKYPNLEQEELVNILNSNERNDNLLKKYGYDIEIDSYIIENDKNNFNFMIIKVLVLVIFFLILIYLFIRYNYKNNKEIDKIIKCIEDINHKNYELKIEEINEDKLSILKQEIYKTTIMLKENAENSLNDKINLKKSLEDISHQLKTPLTSINILLDNIINDPDMERETRSYFINQIKREITNITFLVQSILKLSKLESNTISFVNKKVKVEDLVNESIKKIDSLCDLKNIKIEVDINKNDIIICDLIWQTEALANIIKNCIEHSKDNSNILITEEKNNVYTLIKVKDFGSGIDDYDLKHIFERFYKGKNSDINSIGIGLSLSKMIIESNNGTINVESKVGKGTCFEIKYYN